jgi:hypothetical protein
LRSEAKSAKLRFASNGKSNIRISFSGLLVTF